MAFVKPLNLIYLPLIAGQDVQVPGLVLHLENVGGAPQVDDAAAGEDVFGVAYMTTVDPLYQGPVGSPMAVTGHTAVYLTGVEIAIVREGIVRVPVHQAGGQGNIIPGDLVSVLNANTTGYVRRHVPGAAFAALGGGATTGALIVAHLEEARCIVGVSLSSFTASATTGFIDVVLRIAEQDF